MQSIILNLFRVNRMSELGLINNSLTWLLLIALSWEVVHWKTLRSLKVVNSGQNAQHVSAADPSEIYKGCFLFSECSGKQIFKNYLVFFLETGKRHFEQFFNILPRIVQRKNLTVYFS